MATGRATASRDSSRSHVCLSCPHSRLCYPCTTMPMPKGGWTGSRNPRWNNGTSRSQGYVLVRAPAGHPNARRSGYIAEHVLVMSQHLGRAIATHEAVHHINGRRDDNRLENLQVMTRAAHASEHHKGLIKPASIRNLQKMTRARAMVIWATTRTGHRTAPKTCECCGRAFIRKGKPKHAHAYCSRRCYFTARFQSHPS